MSKVIPREAPGRPASRPADVPAIINVVREVARAHRNGNHDGRITTDDDRRAVRELSDAIRDALVPDRLAEAMVQRFERVAGREIRDVLRERLAPELHGVLRDAAIGVTDVRRAVMPLNRRVSDAIEERVRTALIEGFPSVLRDRFPPALHAALADTTYVRQNDGLAVDDFVDRLLAIAENAIRQRLHDGFLGAVRNCVADVTRERLSDAVDTAARKRPDDADADQIAAAVGQEIEGVLHECALNAVMTRFRAIIANSLHEAAGERVGDALIQAARRAESRATHGSQRAGIDRLTSTRTPAHLAATIEGPVAEEIIAQIADGLRDRVDTTVRGNLNETLRERLPGAIRMALVDQAGVDVVDFERLTDMIHYELAESLRARICDGIRARTAEAVSTRLRKAIRSGIARGRKLTSEQNIDTQ